MKKIAIFLGHPAHFHLYKNVARQLLANGHEINFIIKRKDILEDLLKQEGYKYIVVRNKERKTTSKIGLALSLLRLEWNVFKACRSTRSDILTGTIIALSSKLLRIPIIVCNEDDADVVPRFTGLSYPTATEILTPTVCDNGKWNDKSIKYPSYHELAYLHPNHFIPRKDIVEKYFSTNRAFFILRFAKLTAHHDGGVGGINTKIAQKLIDILEPHGSVYITSERELEPQFEQYRIKINPLDMHHVMAFASLYIGDSQTMAAEAGVLGVPFVRFNDFVGKIGYLRELEDKYELGYGIKPNEEERLYKVVQEIISLPSRKEIFQERRDKMLSEKIDLSKFLTWFLESYPSSKKMLDKNFNFQNRFK